MLIVSGSLFAQTVHIAPSWANGGTLRAPSDVGIQASANIIVQIANPSTAARGYTLHVTWVVVQANPSVAVSVKFVDVPITVAAGNIDTITVPTDIAVTTNGPAAGQVVVKARLLAASESSIPDYVGTGLILESASWETGVAREIEGHNLN